MKSIRSIHYCLIFLSFFLSSVSAFEFQAANAREHITYEDFIHMDQKSKYEIIQMVMEYITLLEGQGPQAEIGRSRKFVHINPEEIKKIWNFFIQTAYADDSSQVFTPVLTVEEMQENSQHLCIYGGWVSFYDPITKSQSGDTGVCVHPSQITNRVKSTGAKIPDNIKKKLEEQQAQYNRFAKGNCAGTEKLACSPSYFGTQDDKGTAICADGNAAVGKSNQSSNNLKNVNTSLQCMLKVNEQTKDGKNEILDRLIKNIESKEGAKNFKTNLQLMYSACLCGDGKFINKSYNDRIFLHRTCYGIILQTEGLLKNLSSSNISCKELSALDFSEVANMTDFTTAVYKSIREKFTAEDYAKFSKNDYNDKSDREHIEKRKIQLELDKKNGLCPIDFGYGIKLKLEPLTGQNKYLVIATPQGINADKKLEFIKWEVDGKYEPGDDLTKIIVPQTDKKIKVKVIFDIDKKPSDDGDVPPLDKKTPTLKLEKESVNEDGTEETLRAKLDGVDPIDPKLFKWKAEEPGSVTPDGKDPAKATVPVLDKPYKVTVTYDDLPPADYTVEPKASCKITRSNEEVEGITTFTVEVPKGSKEIQWIPTPDSAGEQPSLKVGYKNANQVITVKVGELSCELSPDNKGDDNSKNKGLTIEAVKSNEGNLEDEVKAIVKKDGIEGIPEGHSVKWFVKDVIKKEVPKKEEKEKSDIEKEFDAANNVEGKTTPSNGVSGIGEGETTKVKKLDTERQVYAKLYDKEGKEVATSNELPIDKLKQTPPPAVHTGPQRPNQVQPMRFNQPAKGQRGVY